MNGLILFIIYLIPLFILFVYTAFKQAKDDYLDNDDLDMIVGITILWFITYPIIAICFIIKYLWLLFVKLFKYCLKKGK